MIKREDYLSFGKPSFSCEEIEAVTRILKSGWVGMGPETIEFEKELESYLNVPYVVTVNSCTSALFLSLLVHGIGPGDEVICPSLTWCSSANAAIYLGAKVVFCDIDSKTFSVNSKMIKDKITSKTKAVIVVHFGGFAVDVEAIRNDISENIIIIEDAAHALGSKFENGKYVGASGNTTCFSFYANKNLSTGEGGAVAIIDSEKADKIRSLRQHGMNLDAWKRFCYPEVMSASAFDELGYKMNYTDLQACIGRVQLRRQTAFHNIRFSIAKYYYESLKSFFPVLSFQVGILNHNHALHLFLMLIEVDKIGITRNDFLKKLRAFNIGASIHYPPLHFMPLYTKESVTSLPNTENICNKIITLPISASMNEEDAKYVVTRIKEIMNENV